MAKFTVRVDLKDLPYEHPDYVKLDQHMAEQGFSRLLVADRGRAYLMPPGEYDIEGEQSKELICVMARTAAEKVAPRFSILVTKVTSRVWYGLDATSEPVPAASSNLPH